MPRNPEDDRKQEMQEALKRENWSLIGPRRLVKLVKPGLSISHATGYVTVAKFILGKKPNEIAIAVGLPQIDYVNGASIYLLTRIPGVSEIEYDLTAKFPDGLAYVDGKSNPNYQPGSSSIHQWRIKAGNMIQVKDVPIKLGPSQRLAYNDLF